MSTDIFIKLISSSIPGFFTYIYFKNQNILHISKNKAEEIKLTIISFSLLNCLIGLLLFNLLEQHEFSENDQVDIVVVSLIILLINSLVSIFLFPLVFKILRNILNAVRRKKNLGNIEYISNWKKIFHHNGTTLVHIFNFEGLNIYSGVAKVVPEDIEFDYFDMIFEEEVETTEIYTEAESIKFFKNMKERIPNSNYKLYIDFEKKLKFYVWNC
ncbi:hypothetical protein [Carnobacterium maltaromaticum]|uniref:hypothetical protein n=1 Tax=Carnobacterium maltaromaticum TaxID=2751 RepID=UPI00295E8542|nr:hypothetical protein [Carnobacterium maltaromaticum]